MGKRTTGRGCAPGKRPKSAQFAAEPPPALTEAEADVAEADVEGDEANDNSDVEVDVEGDDPPITAPPKPPPLRGDAAALGMTAHEARSSAQTHTNFLLNEKGLSFGDPAARFQRARGAAAASWRIVEDDIRDMLVELDTRARPTAEMASARRRAIQYFYVHVYGSPPECLWSGRVDAKEGGVIAKISKRIGISSDSSRLVRKVLDDICASDATEEQYDADASVAHGASPVLTLDMPEGQIALEALEKGVGLTEATVLVNQYRSIVDAALPMVSWSAVQGFNARCPASDTRKRATKKSGKDDAGGVWAQARAAQCRQFKRQLALALAIAADPAKRAADKSGEPPLFLDGVAFWDEHHDKIRLGHVSKYETRLARDPATGNIALPDDGGEFPERKAVTTVKFPGDGRGCFGACVRTTPDGTKEGVTIEPFDYTGKTVVGNAKFDAAVDAEMRRVLPLKGCWKKPGYGYSERYGAANGYMEAAKTVSTSGKLIPVTLVRRCQRACSRPNLTNRGSHVPTAGVVAWGHARAVDSTRRLEERGSIQGHDAREGLPHLPRCPVAVVGEGRAGVHQGARLRGSAAALRRQHERRDALPHGPRRRLA